MKSLSAMTHRAPLYKSHLDAAVLDLPTMNRIDYTLILGGKTYHGVHMCPLGAKPWSGF